MCICALVVVILEEKSVFLHLYTRLILNVFLIDFGTLSMDL